VREEVSDLKDRINQLKLSLERANSELHQKDQQLAKLSTHY
jgi:HAMP domain-containing protein